VLRFSGYTATARLIAIGKVIPKTGVTLQCHVDI